MTRWAPIGKAVRLECAFAFALLIPTLAGEMQAQSQPSITPTGAPSDLPDAPFAQETAAPQATGGISGTVLDKDSAVLVSAKITLSFPGQGTSTSREILSDNNGAYVFSNVNPGPFELTITAPGFATQKQHGVLQAGQAYLVPRVQMVVATEVDVQVTETQEQVAEEQIRVEEKQRVLGVFPNYYVSYVPDAVPLNHRQKFALAWKASFNPYSVGIAAFFAGLEQANNSFSGYGQGVQGYAKRFGSTYADSFIGTFVGNAILPSLLKQDPRYFYKGTGTKKSRLLYAMEMAFVCKGDNGQWQPNYSNMLGALAAGGISNLYYPSKNRSGVGLTFENAAIGIAGSALGGVVEEFFLRRLTPHAPKDPN